MNTYRIGEAAKATGLSAHTIRFYEGRGLLPPASRSEAGYRRYDDNDLRRLRLIHNARTLGLPIDEVQGLIDGIHTSSCGDYATQVLAVVERQRSEVDRRIAELQRMRADLEALAVDAAAAANSTQRVAECTCCLLMDDGQDAIYCQPERKSLGRALSGEMLEVLQCDIDARPDAPTPDDLERYVRSLSIQGNQLVLRFAPGAAGDVRQFAAAECVCCGGIGWSVNETTAGVILTVSGSPDQLDIIASAWTVPEAAL